MNLRIAALAWMICAAAPGQATPQLDLGPADAQHRPWVTFLGPDVENVSAGKSAAIPLKFHVADGFHINSHAPKDRALIPTRLVVVEGEGTVVRAVDFPVGSEYAFSFDPKTKLDVYTGDFDLVAHVTVARGTHVMHAVLHYQACDHAACYPPKTLPLEVRMDAQ